MPNNTLPAADAGLPNRRLFLAAGSAGAVIAAVSGAAASVAAPTVSPDLASRIDARHDTEAAEDQEVQDLNRLIEAHRAAYGDEERERNERDKAKQIFSAWCATNWNHSDDLRFGCIQLNRDSLDECKEHFRMCLDESKRRRSRDVPFLSMTEQIEAVFEATAAARLSLIEAKFAEHEVAMESSGLPAAQLEYEDAAEAAELLMKDFCASPCTSLRAVRTKAKYLASIHDCIWWPERLTLLSFAGVASAEV